MFLKQLFGNRIKELRTKNKLTQFELAETVGIDAKHLSHIETGRSFPKAVLIEKLAEKFNVDFNYLFDFPIDKSRSEIIDSINVLLSKSSDKDLDKIYKLINLILN